MGEEPWQNRRVHGRNSEGTQTEKATQRIKKNKNKKKKRKRRRRRKTDTDANVIQSLQIYQMPTLQELFYDHTNERKIVTPNVMNQL